MRRKTRKIRQNTKSLFHWPSAFLDPHRIIAQDINHSSEEDRFYCIGRVGDGIMTVRFTHRGNVIRIYGAGYWRKGRKIYEEQNKIQ